MIKNRKGFMLVEVIITSTVILTSMVVLYSSYQHLFTKYESRSNYHHIDALYASKEMADYLFQEDFNHFINTTLYANESIYFIKDNKCQEDLNISGDFSELCVIIQELYSVENMIFTSYDAENLKHIRNGLKEGNVEIESVKNQTMKEYIDYIISYYNITNANINVENNKQENPYAYFIITEIKDGEDHYYASLPIR